MLNNNKKPNTVGERLILKTSNISDSAQILQISSINQEENMLTNVFIPEVIGYPKENLVQENQGLAIETRFGLDKANESVIGSCYFNMGKTKLISYVSAPRPNTGKNISFEKGCLECEVSFAAHLKFDDSCVYDAKNYVDGCSVISNRLANAVIDALNPAIRFECYPKCVINISIMLLESSYQDIAAVINASTLALCDAAVEMRDLVTSYPVYIQPSIEQNGNSSNNSDDVDFALTIACMCNLQEITYLDSIGQRNPLHLIQTIESGKQQCEKVRDILRQEIIQSQQSKQ